MNLPCCSEMITALKAEISEPGVLVNRHFTELAGEEHRPEDFIP